MAGRPLKGRRIPVDLPGVDLGGSQVLMKESIAKWLGLTISNVPTYGTFGSGSNAIAGTPLGNTVGAGQSSNSGYPYTRHSGGFRYESFKVVLKSGTSIQEPGGTSKTPKTISIGFPRGKKGGKRLTVKKIVEYLKGCSQKNNIVGIITPSGKSITWNDSFQGSYGSGNTSGSNPSGTGGTGGTGLPNINIPIPGTSGVVSVNPGTGTINTPIGNIPIPGT